MQRICPILPNDGPLARRVKTSVALSPFRNLKALEIAANLPRCALSTFLTAPHRQTPERRGRILAAIETHLSIPAAEIAALASLNPDGSGISPTAPASGILEFLQQRGDITAKQAEAARWFVAAAGGLSFPSLNPCKSHWKKPLLAAWKALEAADTIIARQHKGCPPASFTVWRIVIERDRPGWLSPDADPELARFERLAFWTGLNAIAAQVIGEAA